MSIEGQGHFFTIYFPGFVLYYAKISGERLQDHWSSGFIVALPEPSILLFCYFSIHYENTPMQYTAILHGLKNDNFQMKNCDIFLIFA